MRFRQDKAAVRNGSPSGGSQGEMSARLPPPESPVCSIQMIQDRDSVIERLFIGVNFPDGMNRIRPEKRPEAALK